MRRRYEAECPTCGWSISTDDEGMMECAHGRWYTENSPAVTTSYWSKPVHFIRAWEPPRYEYAAEGWGAL